MTPLTITGTGICPVNGVFGLKYPKIYLKDKVTGEDRLLTPKNKGTLDDAYQTNKSCTEATFYVPKSYLTLMQDDSKVVVEIQMSDEEKANSELQNTQPNYLTFGEGLQIDNVSPVPAVNNGELMIVGIGFNNQKPKNKVYFTDRHNNKVSADVLSSSSQKLVVQVPATAVTGTLTVEVGDKTATTTVEISAIELIITFGDNGNLTDDSFQVSIDGSVINESIPGERKHTIKMPISIGEKTLSLKGITVPDSLATYYICFSNNVAVLSGTTSGRVTFAEGDQFQRNFKIKVKPLAVSNPVNCNYIDTNTNAVKVLWQE